jgi:LytR cell envelope-related transcriptional attenuator
VDHRADLPATPPWRSAAFIAVSVATVELLILLIVGIWLFGKFFSDEVSKATDPTTVARVAVERELKERGQLPQKSAAKPDGKPLLARAETSVLVLNGNGVTGAASDFADRVRGRYLIAGTGNASRTDYPRSIVMFRPGLEREARRLAKDLGVRRVVPLDGMRPAELQGAHVALVVGG